MYSRTIEISETVKRFLESIPPDVSVVAAAKGRTQAEVEAVIKAGINHIGHNYVQQAQKMIPTLREKATWHMIGHLQRNKVNKAIQFFDIIETVDSLRLAETIEQRCAKINKVMPVLVEINSGREPNKTGVLPEEADELVATIAKMEHLQLQGLMTMGPRFGDPEDSRPYFQATRDTFNRLKEKDLHNVSMRYLSMGMSNSYLIAIEEGANIIRVGTKIFGPRPEL